uniref:P2X purinoceptor n=1 Tax=Aquila chrysaetos chrysaetos TaxID=223781 RepID=A0A663FIS1_AQUCH
MQQRAVRVTGRATVTSPPQGTSVFVVVTKQILTENQVQGVCPESEAEYRCTADRDCQGKSPTTGSGVLTGRCVPYNGSLSTCEIQGWCPPEVDTVDVPVMLEAENFTLFIKNSIRFPLFGFEKANLPPPGSWGELGRCRFHPERQPLCPILRLGDVVRLAGQDFPTLAATGGVLGIKIGWVCDLDRAWERCLPRYSFTRLDGLARPPAPAPGYNFRYSTRHRMGTRVSHACAQPGTAPVPHVPAQARPVLPLAGWHRAPHPHQGLRHPLRRPGVRQCWEVWHRPHPHQHGGSFHLYWRGARGWRARAPHQPHGMSPWGAGGLQPRQAVHRLGHLLPRPLALGAMGQPPTCPPLWGSPLPAPGRGAPAPSPPQSPQWLAPPFPHWQWDRAQGAYGAVGDAGGRGAGGAMGTTS